MTCVSARQDSSYLQAVGPSCWVSCEGVEWKNTRQTVLFKDVGVPNLRNFWYVYTWLIWILCIYFYICQSGISMWFSSRSCLVFSQKLHEGSCNAAMLPRLVDTKMLAKRSVAKFRLTIESWSSSFHDFSGGFYTPMPSPANQSICPLSSFAHLSVLR